MMTKLTICFYVVLLPTTIYGVKYLHQYAYDVEMIAEAGGQIERIFHPLGNRSLGQGSNAFVYKGIFLPDSKEIAMKFTLPLYNDPAEKEYQMYTYLDAIYEGDGERYGIPTVCYFGKWKENNLSMMGLPLLDQNLDQLKETQELYKNDLNVLIIMRDFILCSKYMHWHGVLHNDIKPANILVHKHRSFIIDFGGSSKVGKPEGRRRQGSSKFGSRRLDGDEDRHPIDDWESFLYSICDYLDVPLRWLTNYKAFYVLQYKSNTADNIKKIEEIESPTLREILVEFVKHIYDDGVEGKRIPDYDYFYNKVNEKIKEINSDELKPAVFTWLTDSQKEKSIKDLMENPLPHITDIRVPQEIDFAYMQYPPVDPDKFIRMYPDWEPKGGNSVKKMISKMVKCIKGKAKETD